MYVALGIFTKAKFLWAHLLQGDNFIFFPKDEQRWTLQLVLVLSLTNDSFSQPHEPNSFKRNIF